MHHAIEQSQLWINDKPLYQCERTLSSEPISLVFIDRGDAMNLESSCAWDILNSIIVFIYLFWNNPIHDLGHVGPYTVS
jgi:hypothetical protein